MLGRYKKKVGEPSGSSGKSLTDLRFYERFFISQKLPDFLRVLVSNRHATPNLKHYIHPLLASTDGTGFDIEIEGTLLPNIF